MKKSMKRVFAAALTAVLVGGMPAFSVSAEEFDENNTEITAPAEEPEVKVTGKRETLKCSDASRDLDWGFFSEIEGSADWYGRLALPEYASGLYFTLADESIWLNDSNFSEDTAFRISYSGKGDDVFNAITVLDMSGVARMSDEEWEEIKENISNAYIAAKRDYPGMFWLKGDPKVTRVASSWTDETGEEIYSYQVYFLLKNYSRDYDIRSAKYQSAEAIQAVMTEREQSAQTVLDGTADMDAAGMITYFNDNYKSVAKSMGLSKENYLNAFKLLCDRAGIPCVLASGAGGSMECFVSLDGVWYEPAEVKDIVEEQKREEEKKAEEAAKKAEEEAKAAEEAEKEQAEAKAEPTKTTKKARNAAASAPTAGPAFQSDVPVVAAASTRDGDVVKFYLEDGTTLLEGGVLKAKLEELGILKENPALMIYENYWTQMVTVDGRLVESGIVAKVNDVEVENLKFALKDTNQPLAGNRTYTVICTGKAGSTLISGDVYSQQVTVAPRALNVGAKGLTLRRTYLGMQPGDFAVDNNKLQYNKPIGDVKVTGAATDIDNSLKEDFPGSYDGTVSLKITLSGADALNYTLGQQGDGTNSVERKEEDIIYEVRYTTVAQNVTNLDFIHIDFKSSEEYYVYDGKEKRPDFEVTINNDTLQQGVDYEVRYKDNIDATTDAQVILTSLESGKKYKWEGEKTGRFTITKVKPSVAKQEISTKCGKTETFDVSSLIPEESKVYSATSTVGASDSIFAGSIQVGGSGKNISYTLKTLNDDPDIVGKTGTINIFMDASKNYESFEFELEVTVLAKEQRENFRFEYDVLKIPAGSDPRQVTVLESSDALADSKVTYTIDQANSDAGAILLNTEDGTVDPVKEGEAVIIATATESPDYEAATAQCKVIVIPKENTITHFPDNDEGFQAGGSEYYKLEIETGISYVPDTLDADEYKKPSDIDARMREKILEFNSKVPEENIMVYDITLMIRQDAGDSKWKVIDNVDDFPENGITMTIPYPVREDGTVVDPNTNDFTIAHMFTHAGGDGKDKWEAGDIEELEATERDDGLLITVRGLSPVAVGWEEAQNELPDDPNNPNNPDNPDNPDDPNNPMTPNGTNNNTGTNNNQGSTNGTTTGTGRSATGTTTGTGTTAGTTTASKGALTGDHNQILLYAVLLGAAAFVIGTVCVIRKKRK